MKRFYHFIEDLRFGFSEVDVTLNGLEMLQTICLSVAICATPFIIKWILGVFI